MEFKKPLHFSLSSVLFMSLFMFGCQEKPQEQLPLYYMERSFPELAQSWDEGIPLGNATLGALVWQKEGKLRFSLDRADLWDLRQMENLDFEKYDFNWVVKNGKLSSTLMFKNNSMFLMTP
jgi:alpha-L-fucosidase 2